MEDFAVGTIAWELGDEDEEARIYVEGTVQTMHL